MQANEIVKEVLKEKNINQGEFTELLGMKYQSGVSQALSRDMKISMLSRFADVLGCEVVFRDKSSEKEWIVGNPNVPSATTSKQTKSTATRPSVDLDALLSDEPTKTSTRKIK